MQREQENDRVGDIIQRATKRGRLVKHLSFFRECKILIRSAGFVLFLLNALNNIRTTQQRIQDTLLHLEK